MLTMRQGNASSSAWQRGISTSDFTAAAAVGRPADMLMFPSNNVGLMCLKSPASFVCVVIAIICLMIATALVTASSQNGSSSWERERTPARWWNAFAIQSNSDFICSLVHVKQWTNSLLLCMTKKVFYTENVSVLRCCCSHISRINHSVITELLSSNAPQAYKFILM